MCAGNEKQSGKNGTNRGSKPIKNPFIYKLFNCVFNRRYCVFNCCYCKYLIVVIVRLIVVIVYLIVVVVFNYVCIDFWFAFEGAVCVSTQNCERVFGD